MTKFHASSKKDSIVAVDAGDIRTMCSVSYTNLRYNVTCVVHIYEKLFTHWNRYGC